MKSCDKCVFLSRSLASTPMCLKGFKVEVNNKGGSVYRVALYNCKKRKTETIKTKAKDLKKLIKELDDAFGNFIRYRDRGICITCFDPRDPKYFNPSDRKGYHAGHMFSRRHMNTRWDEFNVFGQCAGCNKLQSMQGNGDMVLKVIERHGIEQVNRTRADSRISFKPCKDWLEEQIGYYLVELEKLKNDKHMAH